MSKKHYNIRNTYNTTNEIDYDKLAESIVNAITKNRQSQKQNSITASMFSGVCSVVFKGMAVLAGAFAIMFILIPIYYTLGFSEEKFVFSFSSISIIVILSSILVTFAIMFWKASDEEALENDKNFLVSLFSSMVSVAALIVASLSFFLKKS